MEDFPESSGGFSLPPDAGIRPLDFRQDNGLCTECEGRPAMFAVEPPGKPARRLCPECLFREFAPKPLSPSEMHEQHARHIAELERTATPEQLGHMAEFLEESWGSKPRPWPGYVEEFIARYAAFAPPPAVPTIGGIVSPEDGHAAELALLVMRGALAEKHTIDEHQYVVDPDPTPISREQAADRLARMPKPLRCVATAPDGVMKVRCRQIVDADALATHAQMAGGETEGEAYFSHLQQEWGDRYPALRIFCAGWRESLVVSAAEVERYQRDYEVGPMGTNAGPPSGYLAANPDVARAAVAAGAVYVMECHFDASDWTPEKEGRVIDVRPAESWDFPNVFALTPDLDSTCEMCGQRSATWRATDTRSTPWKEELLCSQCTANILAPLAIADGERFLVGVKALSEKGRRSVARDIAARLERMERWWKHLPVPAEVAAVLARCRAA
ncbi:MAG: hypothetical protein HOQ09_02525 [Gemmatimonadaceae bacterium]|nr:hypothetical protein [Gemmatimonadaceae bacterium]